MKEFSDLFEKSNINMSTNDIRIPHICQIIDLLDLRAVSMAGGRRRRKKKDLMKPSAIFFLLRWIPLSYYLLFAIPSCSSFFLLSLSLYSLRHHRHNNKLDLMRCVPLSYSSSVGFSPLSLSLPLPSMYVSIHPSLDCVCLRISSSSEKQTERIFMVNSRNPKRK